MNFEIRKTTGKEEYQFFLVDKNKRILTSDKFASRDACTNTIKSLINAGGDANNYQIAQDGNDYFMTISAADGSPLALSSAFTTATEAEGLKQKLPNEFFDDREFEVTFVTTRVQRRKSTEKIEMYDLSYKSSGKKGFDTYKNGKIFYFAFNNDSGEIVLYGRAQKTGTKRKDDIWYIITKHLGMVITKPKKPMVVTILSLRIEKVKKLHVLLFFPPKNWLITPYLH